MFTATLFSVANFLNKLMPINREMMEFRYIYIYTMKYYGHQRERERITVDLERFPQDTEK